MADLSFTYYCYVCGHKNRVSPEIPKAPSMKEHKVICENCQDMTHILVTSCPTCNNGVKYFLSDLDFPEEVRRLAEAYVKIVKGIKESLSEYIQEFNVALPKRWTVKLQCTCGENYLAEIPLPHRLDS